MNLGNLRFSFLLTALFLCLQGPVHADSALVVQGLGAIKNDNIAAAEQTALDDAFYKAIISEALKYIPRSASTDLILSLPEYHKIRGSKDITQYQITARDQRQDTLNLTVELKIDPTYLKQWLHSNSLNTPLANRPNIAVMFSIQHPENDMPYEWWTMRSKAKYSAFEEALTEALVIRGENISLQTPKLKGFRQDFSDPFNLAEKLEADILINGVVSYTTLQENLYAVNVEAHILDAQSRSVIKRIEVFQRADFNNKTINKLIAESIADDLHSEIARRLASSTPITTRQEIIISGIRDFRTYQAMLAAIDAMNDVEDIQIASIQGHEIRHTATIQGNIEDVLKNLASKQIAEIDVSIKNNAAIIEIISR